MGNYQSKDEIKIYNTGDYYTAFVDIGSGSRILCKSTDISYVKHVITKYKKDPGGFTFRYKI